MNSERLRSFARNATLAALPVTAIFSACADQRPITITLDAPTPANSPVNTAETRSPEQIIIENAQKLGRGVVFLVIDNIPSELHVRIRLDRMDGPSPKDTHLDRQSNDLTKPDKPGRVIRWFETASCQGTFRLATSKDAGVTWRAVIVPDENGEPKQTFTFDPNACTRAIDLSPVFTASQPH